MPSALAGHAAMPVIAQEQSRREAAALAKNSDGGRERAGAPAAPVGDARSREAASKKILDKQSIDYLWRSGVAGGAAGCAVGFTLWSIQRDVGAILSILDSVY